MPRHRKPLHLRLIDGDFSRTRHNAREPATTGPASRKPPRHLSASAKRCWRELIERAPEATLRSADEFLIEIAASLLADFREFSKAGRAAPLVETSLNGSRVNVLRAETRKLAGSVHKLLSELGYTPASRSRIVVDQPSDGIEAGLGFRLYNEMQARRAARAKADEDGKAS